jgi:hypothetical protein
MEFYFKDIIVEVRKSDILVQHIKADEAGDSNDQYPVEIFKQANFVFKTWQLDTDTSVRKLFDLEQQQIVLKLSGLDEDLQIDVMS